MADQELRLTAKADGFDQAAQQVGKVADAEKKLGDAVSGNAGSTQLGNEQFRNLVGLLRDIDPGVGRLVDGFGRAIQFADALGKSNLNLKDILGQVTGGLSKMTGALALIGTGAGIAAGIALIAHAFADLKREAAEVHTELERQRKTLDDLARGRSTRAQEIENISDLRRGLH